MKLYSKETAVRTVSSMVRRGRISHAYIICGEKGVGKKTLAKYISSAILCSEKSGEPCGNCKSCKMMSHSAHPDFIEIEPSGKSGNYRADDLRPIIADSAVTPNEGEKKIYYLPGIDRALPAAQNVLLKIVEEPPAHVVFVMTAESKEKILPTILSRAISLYISEASEEECLEALKEKGISELDAKKAVSVFGGNIGKCLEYLSDEEQEKLPDAVNRTVSAMISGDEYGVLKSFSPVEKDRALCLEVLAELKTVLRDASAIKYGAPPCSVSKDGAKKLSEMLRQSAIDRMYSEVSEAERRIGQNGSIALCLAGLCGKLTAR